RAEAIRKPASRTVLSTIAVAVSSRMAMRSRGRRCGAEEVAPIIRWGSFLHLALARLGSVGASTDTGGDHYDALLRALSYQESDLRSFYPAVTLRMVPCCMAALECAAQQGRSPPF